MRIGEITGLRWKFVSFGDIENGFEDAVLHIDAQLQRISTQAYEALQRKKDHIVYTYPARDEQPHTMLVLKNLKTDSSRRVVWIPKTTAEILWALKQEQDGLKQSLGDEYIDYDLVIAQRNGHPVESGTLSTHFNEFIELNGFPKVEFHSLRHLSATVKLLISNGDVKSVQGDTGHAQAKMVLDTYGHILDQERKKTAKRFESSFYEGDLGQENDDRSLERLLAMCLKDPEALQKLRMLFGAKTD